MSRHSIDPELDPSFVADSVRRKRKRNWVWRIICLLLMPLGVAVPFAMSTITENQDLHQYSAMAALAIIVAGLTGLVFTLFAIPGLRKELLTTEQAEQIGFRYASESEKESFTNLLQDSRLFLNADGVNVNVALMGEVEGHSSAFLEISYAAAGSLFEMSVVVLAGAGEGLPEFLMFPLGWLEKLAEKVMSDKGLKLPGQAEFNRTYKLRGEEEEAIRALFTPQRIQFCLSGNPFYLESKDGVLIVSRDHGLKDIANMVLLGNKTRKRFGV